MPLVLKMNPKDVLKEYQNAKKPRDQIAILADQNLCTKQDMALWLHEHGAEVDKRMLPKPKPATEPLPDDEPVAVVPAQDAKADSGKPMLSLVPIEILYAIERVRRYGTEKYHSPDNWKNVSVDRYWEAFLRHTVAAWNDYRAVDPESGLRHIDHMVCNLAFIIALLGVGE